MCSRGACRCRAAPDLLWCANRSKAQTCHRCRTLPDSCAAFFVLTKKRLVSAQMSLPSMLLLYSMLGEPFTVMLTFVRLGLKYFSESLAPSAYGSTKRRRILFRDLLWGLTLMFILLQMPFGKATISSRIT